MHRKIFIDCGFYAGGSLEHFKLTPEYSPDFIYYGFDPMLNIEQAREKWKNITLDNKAVWIKDDEIDFYTSDRHQGRANGISHNKRASKEGIRKVKCIDFSKWLGNNFDADDYIILKMDVEGAEYELLPRLIKDSTINLVDIIYLEWHAGRMGDVRYQRAKVIADELKKKEGLVIRGSLERYLRALRRSKNKNKGKI